MACLTLKDDTIVMVNSLEAFSEPLGEGGRTELLEILAAVRPELQQIKSAGMKFEPELPKQKNR